LVASRTGPCVPAGLVFDAAIADEIAHVLSLSSDALQRRWRAEFGRKSPAGLSKELLGRMIAMRLQEQTFGGLDREKLTFLDGFARRGVSPRRHLKPGTVLVREYQGERHTVTVVREGFEWQGTTYTSLSAIARAVTGTAWSGPRFFALRTPADRAPPSDPAKRSSQSDGAQNHAAQHHGAVRLIIPDLALGPPVLRTLSLCTCCRHYPGAATGRITSLNHPVVSAFPERVVGSACASAFSGLARRSLALRPAHSRCHRIS
jgi:hypothetical protein